MNIIIDEGVGYLSVPLIIFIFVIVVRCIIVFKVWYVGEKKFELILIAFAYGMYKILVGTPFLYVIGWEGIRLISFLLISYWGRSESISASIAAVMYNRAGDVFLLLVLVRLMSPVYALIAVCRKSAMWSGSYWLPMAIEGPTPVSSLLHSSTMVVARLYLRSILSFNMPLLMILVRSYVLTNNIVLNDIKKMIAFSTATNLVFIGVMLSLSMYGVVILHICVHAFFKASAFIWSGVIIHSNGEQNNNNTFSLHILLCMVILLGLPGFIPGISKELLMLELFILMILIMILALSYSKVFTSGMLLIESICILLLPLCLVVVVIGGILVMDARVVILSFLVVFQLVISFLWR